MFKKILCALDGSAHSKRALAVGIDMAKKFEAELVFVHTLIRSTDTSALQRFAEIEGLTEHVAPELKRLEGMDAHLEIGSAYEDRAVATRVLVEVGQHILNDARIDAKENGLTNVSVLLVDGEPADQILRCIEERSVDCVVMGSRGLSDIKALFLGSVSHKVMNRAPCTCIAVK